MDSWIAVAMAIVTARSGIPRVVPTAEIVAAFAAWCRLISYVWSPSGARTTQRGADSVVEESY
ncbi:hypothetical protein GCM10010498_13080 [Streptomyces cavourensis]|nr:hypothetical protein GCM10010498_13080 [Streptomyces cavourensis]